jgi:hypothetical protein
MEEEINWYQCSKAKNLMDGDSDTKYFYLLANGRHRKIRIFQLQDGDKQIFGNTDLKNISHPTIKGSLVHHMRIPFGWMRAVGMIFHKS